MGLTILNETILGQWPLIMKIIIKKTEREVKFFVCFTFSWDCLQAFNF